MSESIWRPPLGRLTFGLVLVVAATAFEALAVATILPETTRALGGLAWYGWTFSAFMLATLVGITFGGQETDRHGPTLPFVIGTLLFSGGLVISGLAGSMPMIVVGRTAQGLGSGLLSAVAYASIARAYSVDLQPRTLATLSSAWVIPGLVGPGLASVVSQQVGWRFVFLGLAPLPILAAILVLPPLRRVEWNSEAAPDRGRTWLALQLALGSAMALAGGGLRDRVVGLIVATVGVAVAIAALTRLMPEGTLVARPGLPASIATMGLINFAFFGTEAFVPLAQSAIRGASLATTGLALTCASLCWTVGAWLPVRLGARVSRRALTLGGLGGLGAAILGAIALLSSRVPSVLVIPIWAIGGLGMGVAFTATSAAILAAAPRGQEGEASSLLQLAQVLGTAVATGIAGTIVAAPFAGNPPTLGIAVVDGVMLAVAGLSAVAASGIPDQREG